MGSLLIDHSTAICIANGVDFVDHSQKRMHHGDLFQLENVYIVNGNGCEWLPFDPAEVYKVVSSREFFYRNGIFVFSKKHARFNQQLKLYIGIA